MIKFGKIIEEDAGAGLQTDSVYCLRLESARAINYKDMVVQFNEEEYVMVSIKYHPIGIIHSPHKSTEGTPIQPTGAKGIKGKIEIFPEYTEGLSDLAEFSHIFILYHFHLSRKYSLKVKPFLDDQERGLFATRAPSRPNPIGLSVVRLIDVKKGNLHVQDVDVVDGTPLLDIKPYVPEFDVREVDKQGWIGKNTGKVGDVVDDGRFST